MTTTDLFFFTLNNDVFLSLFWNWIADAETEVPRSAVVNFLSSPQKKNSPEEVSSFVSVSGCCFNLFLCLNRFKCRKLLLNVIWTLLNPQETMRNTDCILQGTPETLSVWCLCVSSDCWFELTLLMWVCIVEKPAGKEEGDGSSTPETPSLSDVSDDDEDETEDGSTDSEEDDEGKAPEAVRTKISFLCRFSGWSVHEMFNKILAAKAMLLCCCLGVTQKSVCDTLVGGLV